MVVSSFSARLRMHVRPEHFDWTLAVLETFYRVNRVYHTIEHIDACLAIMERLALDQPEGTINKQLASLALIFHDVIYVAGQPDNEKNSLSLLEGMRFVLNDESLVPRVAPLILATAHKAEEVVFGDATLAAVVDIDLSILGVGLSEYSRYVDSVRREFHHVSNEAWRVGRSGFLAQMLARRRIFTLASMRADYEAQARRNMADELKLLGA